MQHVWRAPVPGLFLGLVWIVSKPGPVFIPNWEDERALAFHRPVFVIDPRADSLEVQQVRARLDELGQVARRCFGWSRAANALVCAVPVVLAVVWWWASGSAEPGTAPLTEVVLPVTIAYALVAIAFAIPRDRLTRQAVRRIAEFRSPGVLRSSWLGRDKFARGLIARLEERSADEQRQVTEILWRVVGAERARREYLDSAEVFDEAEFAVLRGQVESAELDLRAWAGAASIT